MNIATYGKIYAHSIQNLYKTHKQRKRLLKCTSKPSYMSHKLFDNNLVVIHKSKVLLKFKKPAYI